MALFGVLSYGTAALIYGALSGVLMLGFPGGRSAAWMTAAMGLSCLWGIAMAVLASGVVASFGGMVALDALYMFVWTACMLSWFAPFSDAHGFSARRALLAGSVTFAFLATLASALGSGEESWAGTSLAAAAGRPVAGSWSSQSAFLALLAMALIGLLAVEQIYRNSRDEERRQLRLPCLAVGAVFVFHVLLYSQPAVLRVFMPGFWEARGIVTALLAPFLLMGMKRRSDWVGELFVSRQVAFYTGSLVAVGAYLLAIGAVATFIRELGGRWALLLLAAFLFAALMVLVLLARSSGIRARAKVFIIKHFYRNKYDYRQEWLELTAALSETGNARPLASSALDGIARIVGAREGALWLAGEDGHYEQKASLGPPADASTLERYGSDHPFIRFLVRTDWVLDGQEYSLNPDLYENAFGPSPGGLLPENAIVVPLNFRGFLQGFVTLSRPPELWSLNFEDHDILKTAGRQAAVVLAQALAQEQLTATRQFEAINRLTTFVMHDLKNLIAQQELMVANAQRFKHRPEFVADAVETVRAGVQRMKKVLEQLQSASYLAPMRSYADVSKVLMEVRSHCSDREPVPRIDLSGAPIRVAMDKEKLASVLTHLIRNAQDATPADGSIAIELDRSDGQLLISVADTGTGMDSAFVRDRLFKPFDSTKGSKGMGIGVYQVRHMVRVAGGEVDVTSEPGAGTTFLVRLPLGVDQVGDQPAA